ncbi:MAG: hypothetical protein LWY06_07010, partial [Firmicutes bacterium]|nr:hypothetical protein [Bacillota bacterium]
ELGTDLGLLGPTGDRGDFGPSEGTTLFWKSEVALRTSLLEKQEYEVGDLSFFANSVALPLTILLFLLISNHQ